ncbi:hypothetical protein FB570_12165 [Streptomyces sp. T12]|nr:hypothetical protein FB570_12165 [Streptomyces sp. T12]
MDLAAPPDSTEVAARPHPSGARMRTPDLNGGTGDFD